MGKEIAVLGCQLQDTPAGGASKTIQIITPPSQTVKIDNKGVYCGTLTVMIAGHNGGGAIQTGAGTGAGTISGTSISTKIDNQPAVLKDDLGVIVVSGPSSANPQVTVSVPVTVKISDAGQTSCKTD